jgi:hypothetical protein
MLLEKIERRCRRVFGHLQHADVEIQHAQVEIEEVVRVVARGRARRT